MIFKLLKKNQILFFILFFLISISIIILTIKLDRASTIKTGVIKDNKTLESNLTTQKNLTEISPLFINIDLIGKDYSLFYSKPILEIDQIMEEQKKINTFREEKYLIKKKEGWIVDYEIRLEDGVIEDLITDPSLKLEMINGKIEFSKSF